MYSVYVNDRFVKDFSNACCLVRNRQYIVPIVSQSDMRERTLIQRGHMRRMVQTIGRAIGRPAGNPFVLMFVFGIGAGVFGLAAGRAVFDATSSDAFCEVCHAHPQAAWSWRKGPHYKNTAGMVAHCADCHLPPAGLPRFYHKARMGLRDVWGTVAGNPAAIDWDARSVPELAATYTFDAACRRCHQDLYSLDLTPKGVQGHEYYLANASKIRCINCHLTAGHWHAGPAEMVNIPTPGAERIVAPVYPPSDSSFRTYTETILGTGVTFNMVAVPGGTVEMGSPPDEPFRDADEGPQTTVTFPQFWMGEIEVSWAEFDAFLAATGQPGRHDADAVAAVVDTVRADAVTGPTPPYGNPDQGWGRGLRPAITMTRHAAETYCRWLSAVTGATYRLPTEAEWEYACRAGTAGPYWFDADPRRVSGRPLRSRLFGPEDSAIAPYAWFDRNSGGKTQPGYTAKPNPFGLYNMLGNVWEFTATPYRPELSGTGDGSGDAPAGTASSDAYASVIRGGSYRCDPADLRCAMREPTRDDAWLMTDPQSPKSIWWYSDCRDVGFRVVRQYDGPAVGTGRGD